MNYILIDQSFRSNNSLLELYASAKRCLQVDDALPLIEDKIYEVRTCWGWRGLIVALERELNYRNIAYEPIYMEKEHYCYNY